MPPLPLFCPPSSSRLAALAAPLPTVLEIAGVGRAPARETEQGAEPRCDDVMRCDVPLPAQYAALSSGHTHTHNKRGNRGIGLPACMHAALNPSGVT